MREKCWYAKIIFMGAVIGALAAPAAAAQVAPPPDTNEHSEDNRRPMTADRLGEIIRRIDDDAEREGGVWRLEVKTLPVTVVTDAANDRMRILIPVARAGDLNPKQMIRIMQANFDTALDARYAIGQDLLWSTYIHPLGALNDEEFLSALGQTVNLAVTFGTTFTSGALIYGGGDSQGILERQLIDDLIRRGKAT